MKAETKTFSESWYRIADRRVALHPHVEVRRQHFRGERFHVLRDPFTNAFFRLRLAAYQFVARLRMDKTVDAVWRESMEADPEQAPGQDHVLHLLAQLHASNLLQSNLPPDSGRVFERYQARRQKETKAQLTNILFARFPILNPDPFLTRILPLLRKVISPAGAFVWLAVVAVALKTLADHASEFAVQTQALLAPGNLPWLFLALAGLKLWHEFGHAAVCRRLGGEVPTLGVMLMIFTPVPFVDTTSSWAFRSRWHRALVGAAGMVFEVFVAALAVFVWANTGECAIHSIAYNLVIVASVATFLFNINPLLRFDGYYILSDLLEIPNLQLRSGQQLKYLCERWLFGVKSSRGPASSKTEAVWLAIYGLLGHTYRLFLSVSILLFLSSAYLLLGLVLAVSGAITWLAVPCVKLFSYVALAPQLARHRFRAVFVCAALFAGILGLLGFLPAPQSFRAPGILQAAEDSGVSTASAGRVVSVIAVSGAKVGAGEVLLRMENPELELEIAGTEAQLREARAQRERALEESTADLEPIDSRIAAIEKGLLRLREDSDALVVRAPHAGVWVAPDVKQFTGTWLSRGVELGRVVDFGRMQFSAVIPQDEASRLFAGTIRAAAVRLSGASERELRVVSSVAIPAEQERLPSAALSWVAGGEVSTAAHDPQGLRVSEPFYEVRSTVDVPSGFVLRNGGSGRIRFELPPEPLLPQWTRKLRQLMQRRGLG